MQEAIAQIVIELQLPILVVAIAWKHGVKLEDAARVRQMWTIQDATCRMFQNEGAPTLGATVHHLPRPLPKQKGSSRRRGEHRTHTLQHRGKMLFSAPNMLKQQCSP